MAAGNQPLPDAGAPVMRTQTATVTSGKFTMAFNPDDPEMARLMDIQQKGQTFQIYANDNASLSKDYQTLIVAYRNGAAVRLSDVAEVFDGVENVRNLGTFNGKPAILVQITKQPGANVIKVVDSIREQLPDLKAALPVSVDQGILFDTTTSIRNAVHDVEVSLILSTVLVILVVFLFLRNFKATLVPTICVPLSLLGTFEVMYMLGFSLNNFSLMALIVSTGFVVDNTIVVLENVTRHLENGEDRITAALETPAYRPRALFERFNIELIATTEGPLDPLLHHAAIRDSGWQGRVITAYRPDPVIDPEHEQFPGALRAFGELTGEDVYDWNGYLRAHRQRRAFFAAHGATSTDHGHPSAVTANLDPAQARRLFEKVVAGKADAAEAELFRGQMLTEMALMSLDDGLVMQLHPGCFRNHNQALFQRFGRDKGADIPLRTEYVHALKPLLDRCGNDPRFKLILFTLDESNYARELAPLAGHYPSLLLGPAWWFHDAPEGMWRFREQTLSSGGFYNTVGFNDDTRAFLSIPARHDVARRVDCAFLAKLVAEHRTDEDEAVEVAIDLAYRLPKQAYRL